MIDPRASGRRRLALALLAVGAVAIAVTLGKDYPHAQPLVFRTDDTSGAILTASFTKVGEAEARTGFTLTLPDHRLRDVSHTIHVPDGDYIVTIELRPAPGSASGDAPRPPEETSVARRVTLAGSEVVVSVPSRASE